MAVRGMATATKSSVPPVQLFGLDGTYASALYTAAAKSSALEAVEKSLSKLKSIVSKDPKLAEIIANPALSQSDKTAIVEIITKAASLDSASANLLSVLAENNRLAILPEVLSKYETLVNAYHGLVEATVTSAQSLDAKTLSTIEAALAASEFVGEGKKLQLTNKVNSDILGGLVVEIGDKTVDLSVQTKVTRLNQALNESI
ncbi:F-type H+-transporting ATPase oligomycin sensitivity conferral protein [Nadsonia fulvescens var. elongata DSM 6958]|uniref:ATP synthase subunit 5, mitochondrial n=1 Tax=Nadsonia fulvescens var. elongata DSM 6958 TaxID=857566 RepID=A0A1E3PLD1_9ASCO|nr:F-type H+-transporting ATPase oligomycin sensitivity conferral protein [Nadsonia fulvescens var. elongata DSM 6958]